MQSFESVTQHLTVIVDVHTELTAEQQERIKELIEAIEAVVPEEKR